MPPKRKNPGSKQAKKNDSETETKLQEIAAQNAEMAANFKLMQEELRANKEELNRKNAEIESQQQQIKSHLQNSNKLSEPPANEVVDNILNLELGDDSQDSLINKDPSHKASSVVGSNASDDSSQANQPEPGPSSDDNSELSTTCPHDDVSGNDLYCINMKSNFGTSVDKVTRLFDHEKYDFALSSWKKLTPQKVVDIIKSDDLNKHGEPVGGVKKCFHVYFTNFAKQIFKKLGIIYPYLFPPELYGQFCAHFFAKQECLLALNGFFQEYKRDFPGSLFTVVGSDNKPPPNNCTQLLMRKLELQFVQRSKALKDANAWPYSNQLDRETKAVDQAKLREVKFAHNFDYSSWKIGLEKRFDQYRIEISNKKEKKEADNKAAGKPKKKRIRRNEPSK